MGYLGRVPGGLHPREGERDHRGGRAAADRRLPGVGHPRRSAHPQRRHQLRPGHRASRHVHAELSRHHGRLRHGGRHRHPRRSARRHQRLDHPVGPHVHVPWRRRRLEPRLLRARAVLRAVQPHRRLREVPHAVLVRRVGRLQLGHGVHAPRRECPLRDSRGHDRFRRPHEHGQRQLQLGGPAHAGLPLRGEPVALADLGCGGHPSAGVPLDRDERPAHRPGLRRLLQPVRARRRPSGRVQERSSVLPGARPLLRRALLHRPGRSLLGEEVGRDRQVCGPARPGVRVPRR